MYVALDVRRDVLRWQQRLLKVLDGHGRLYVSGKNWSQRHWAWIRAHGFDLAPLRRTFEAPRFALEQALARLGRSRTPRGHHQDRHAHARHALGEAARHYRHRPTLGRALAARSQGQPPRFLAHAWRAQQRLHRRYRPLVGHGQRTPVAVTAIARELVGFIWAAMTQRPAVAVESHDGRGTCGS